MKQSILILLSGTAAMLATIAVLIRIGDKSETTVPEHWSSNPSAELSNPDDNFSPDAFREELLK